MSEFETPPLVTLHGFDLVGSPSFQLVVTTAWAASVLASLYATLVGLIPGLVLGLVFGLGAGFLFGGLWVSHALEAKGYRLVEIPEK